jgi:hypothetical protein
MISELWQQVQVDENYFDQFSSIRRRRKRSRLLLRVISRFDVAVF